MRSLLLSTLGLITIALGWPSPAVAGTRWPLGIKGGLVMTSFSGALGDSVDRFRATVCLGGMSTIPIGYGLTLQPELLFTMKGGRFEQDVGGVFRFDNALVLSYLELPLLLRADLPGRRETVRPYLVGGPAFAYRVNARLATGSYDGSQPVDPDRVGAFDFGVAVGVGARFLSLSNTITVELRLTEGVQHVIEDDGPPTGRNRAWTLSTGYYF